MGQTREFILYIAVVTIALPVEFLLSSLNANLTQQKIYPVKVVLHRPAPTEECRYRRRTISNKESNKNPASFLSSRSIEQLERYTIMQYMYYRPSYQNNIHLMVVWLNKGHDHFVSRILLYQKIRHITIYIATWIIDNNVTTEALCLQKNMVALSRIQLPQLLQSTLPNDIFSQPPFCQGVVHSMLIVLQRHSFIKWK